MPTENRTNELVDDHLRKPSGGRNKSPILGRLKSEAVPNYSTSLNRPSIDERLDSNHSSARNSRLSDESFMKHVEDAMPPEPKKKPKKRVPVGNESDEHYLKISEPMFLTNYFVDKPK